MEESKVFRKFRNSLPEKTGVHMLGFGKAGNGVNSYKLEARVRTGCGDQKQRAK